MIGRTVGELSPFKDMERNDLMLKGLQKNGYVRYDDLPLETRDGRRIAWSSSAMCTNPVKKR